MVTDPAPPHAPGPPPGADIVLVIRRVIAAPSARVFAAWTRPEELTAWWAPGPVTCPAAEIDLREGGAYRIANRFPDGRTIWIRGEFERVEPERELVYSWRLDPYAPAERVTVDFTPRGEATELVIVHARIPSPEAQAGHHRAWNACLDQLQSHLAG